jgi:membrane protease YdiL (CAAX protease family)
MVITGILSQVFGKPFEDPVTATIGRLILTLGVVLLLWRFGWLKDSGVTRSGRWWVWLLALSSIIYYAWAGLYSFFGEAKISASDLSLVPVKTYLTQGVVALSEEIAFRGMVLYALMRAWGKTTFGKIGSVTLTSLLFAVLHFIQFFTLNFSTVLLLIIQTAIIALWWGSLVQSGGSIWPVVVIHFLGNSIVGVQSLSTPVVEPIIFAYRQLLWLSIPLGTLGLGLILLKGMGRNSLINN